MCFKSNLIHSSFPRFYRSLFNGPTLLGIDLNSIESRLILWPCRPIRLDLQFDWMIRNGKESTWSSCSLLLAFLTMAVTSASERLSVATFLKFSAPSAKLHTKFPSSMPQWTFPLRFTALFSWFPPRNERVFSTRISFFNVATPQMAAYTGTAISLFLTLKNGLENIENERSTSSSMSH